MKAYNIISLFSSLRDRLSCICYKRKHTKTIWGNKGILEKMKTESSTSESIYFLEQPIFINSGKKSFVECHLGLGFQNLKSLHFLILLVLYSLNQLNDFGCDENAQIKGTVFSHS